MKFINLQQSLLKSISVNAMMLSLSHKLVYVCIYKDEFGVKILRNDFTLKSCIVLKKLKMLQKLQYYINDSVPTDRFQFFHHLCFLWVALFPQLALALALVFSLLKLSWLELTGHLNHFRIPTYYTTILHMSNCYNQNADDEFVQSTKYQASSTL